MQKLYRKLGTAEKRRLGLPCKTEVGWHHTLPSSRTWRVSRSIAVHLVIIKMDLFVSSTSQVQAIANQRMAESERRIQTIARQSMKTETIFPWFMSLDWNCKGRPILRYFIRICSLGSWTYHFLFLLWSTAGKKSPQILCCIRRNRLVEAPYLFFVCEGTIVLRLCPSFRVIIANYMNQSLPPPRTKARSGPLKAKEAD